MTAKSRRAQLDTSVSLEGSCRALGYRMPAEWEPHAATWLAWPHQEQDWPGKFAPIPWVFAEIIRKLVPAERVRLIVADRATAKRARSTLGSAGVDVASVDFLLASTNRSWTRDFVPSFVVKERGSRPRRAAALGERGRDGIAAVKFRFNGWARYANHREDEAAGQRVARWLGVPAFEPSVRVGHRPRRVVLEGGAIDVDGQGTVLTTEECLLAGRQARNPELGRAGSEQMLAAELGIDKVLWLERGIAGDDTGGHVDDFARFVAPATVVLAREPRPRDPNHRVLEAARERLEGARDARGRKITVVRLPMPSPVAFKSQRLPASYANFYIGSESVLVPTFNDPQDRVALGVLAELFPARQVVGIHALDLVLGLGTIHCSTQQEPR